MRCDLASCSQLSDLIQTSSPTVFSSLTLLHPQWRLAVPQLCSCLKASAFALPSTWNAPSQIPTQFAFSLSSGFYSNVTFSVRPSMATISKIVNDSNLPTTPRPPYPLFLLSINPYVCLSTCLFCSLPHPQSQNSAWHTVLCKHLLNELKEQRPASQRKLNRSHLNKEC